LFDGLKSKWRYNVRLAEKKGVTVLRTMKAEGAKEFFDLVAKTTDRQDFASYDEGYFKTMIEALGKQAQAEFYFAIFEGKLIAGLLVAYFGDVTYYLHGA